MKIFSGAERYMRIGSNILRYEDGQYSVNTGMGIFYTHILLIYICEKEDKKRILENIMVW